MYENQRFYFISVEISTIQKREYVVKTDLDGEKNLFENYKNKVIKPNEEEINLNNRSRSAKLRFVTRSENDFCYPNEFKEKFLQYLELENKHV